MHVCVRAHTSLHTHTWAYCRGVDVSKGGVINSSYGAYHSDMQYCWF